MRMVCKEEGNLTTANGKKFSKGNHPLEMLVTMLDLKAAGFEVEVFTPTVRAALRLKCFSFHGLHQGCLTSRSTSA